MSAAESERAKYLGFPLEITHRNVTVMHPETGRRLGTVTSVKKARLFVRGYRAATPKGERTTHAQTSV